jgi:putative transcriptional regulator
MTAAKKKKEYNRIKEVLAEKGKTQSWLSGEIGVEVRTISRYCSNARQPSLEKIYQMAKALKVSPKDFLID